MNRLLLRSHYSEILSLRHDLQSSKCLSYHFCELSVRDQYTQNFPLYCQYFISPQPNTPGLRANFPLCIGSLCRFGAFSVSRRTEFRNFLNGIGFTRRYQLNSMSRVFPTAFMTNVPSSPNNASKVLPLRHTGK